MEGEKDGEQEKEMADKQGEVLRAWGSEGKYEE